MWQYLGKLKYMHKIPEADFGGYITSMNKKIRTIITHHKNILVVNSQHLFILKYFYSAFIWEGCFSG